VKIQIRLAIPDGGNVADVKIEYRAVFAYRIGLSSSLAKG
jgi:hypothetical protein